MCSLAFERIASARPDRLAMPHARKRALLGLAGALADGVIALDGGADRERVRRRLLDLDGIGPWTTEYIAMRALRDPDAFLPGDVGVRRALERIGVDAGKAPTERVAEGWRPYRAYAVQHLWGQLELDAAPPASRPRREHAMEPLAAGASR